MKSKLQWLVKGGVSSPCGFRASGIHAGIKKKNNARDMALLLSDTPAVAAGVFTLNEVKAAPVLYCKRRLTRKRNMRAVVVNSGCANACTGERGMRDAERTAELAAQALNVDAASILVCSTGTIGKKLPMPAIERGLPMAVSALSNKGGHDAALAIMTTDTRPKEVAVRIMVNGRPVTIGGMAKGAGMIHPNMATLLAFITTDAAVQQAAIATCLKAAADHSFNCISVDGDQSTNDTLLMLANGVAGNRPLGPGHKEWKSFCKAVEEVCLKLALMIVRDGEGATKLVTLRIKGAPDARQARAAAFAVANSLLVKTSWFGADPNWGRVLAALGRSGCKFKPDRVEIRYNDLLTVSKGQPTDYAEKDLHDLIIRPEFTISANLNAGKADFTAYTCDCSEEYVRINASYMT